MVGAIAVSGLPELDDERIAVMGVAAAEPRLPGRTTARASEAR